MEFLQWALPQVRMHWPGFRKVRKQVCRRVGRRLKELGLVDVSSYQNYLEDHPMEWITFESYCRIPISRFYRDRGVFDHLRGNVLPELAREASFNGQDQVRIWTAGSASGEEPYTLSIIWRLEVSRRCPNVELNLVATDIDPHMLERARAACYSRSSLKDFPVDWLPLAFTESEGMFKLKQEFRVGIEFTQQDIRREMPEGHFSAVFCRHLAFTYFDEAAQQDVIARIADKLLPKGIFVTGKQEKILATQADLQEIRPNLGIYRKCKAVE